MLKPHYDAVITLYREQYMFLMHFNDGIGLALFNELKSFASKYPGLGFNAVQDSKLGAKHMLWRLEYSAVYSSTDILSLLKDIFSRHEYEFQCSWSLQWQSKEEIDTSWHSDQVHGFRRKTDLQTKES